jgi:hypothetical protein
MNDEDRKFLYEVLDKREERLRQSLEIERKERELKRSHRLNTWMFRGLAGVAILAWIVILTDVLVTCEARRIVRQEIHLKQKD